MISDANLPLENKQIGFSSLASIVINDRITLYFLLAGQGRVCAKASCCTCCTLARWKCQYRNLDRNPSGLLGYTLMAFGICSDGWVWVSMGHGWGHYCCLEPCCWVSIKCYIRQIKRFVPASVTKRAEWLSEWHMECWSEARVGIEMWGRLCREINPQGPLTFLYTSCEYGTDFPLFWIVF